jgi:hypothetical protein
VCPCSLKSERAWLSRAPGMSAAIRARLNACRNPMPLPWRRTATCMRSMAEMLRSVGGGYEDGSGNGQAFVASQT